MSTPIKNPPPTPETSQKTHFEGVHAPEKSHWSNLLIKLGIPLLIFAAV